MQYCVYMRTQPFTICMCFRHVGILMNIYNICFQFCVNIQN